LSTSAVSPTLSPPEEAHFDDLRFARIEPRLRVHSIVERYKIRRPGPRLITSDARGPADAVRLGLQRMAH
jgi:hypothetical protein